MSMTSTRGVVGAHRIALRLTACSTHANAFLVLLHEYTYQCIYRFCNTCLGEKHPLLMPDNTRTATFLEPSERQ